MATEKKPARRKVVSPFAKNLKRVLAERGISQRTASQIAQIQPSVLTGWLSGAQASDPLAVQRLARGLGCSFEWLLTGTDTQLEAGKISMAELFESEPDPTFSGVFKIEARRLRVKGS